MVTTPADAVECPDVSALVVNYNSADYCLQCVDSLLAQTFEVDGRPGRLEVIVLDNDSRPEDQEKLTAVEKPGVTLIYTGENLGYGPANNRGAALAKGRWLYILNPDVKVLPGAIAAMRFRPNSSPQFDLSQLSPVSNSCFVNCMSDRRFDAATPALASISRKKSDSLVSVGRGLPMAGSIRLSSKYSSPMIELIPAARKNRRSRFILAAVRFRVIR